MTLINNKLNERASVIPKKNVHKETHKTCNERERQRGKKQNRMWNS